MSDALDIREWDMAVVTGTDTDGHRYHRYPFVVSTVTRPDPDEPFGPYVKLWPEWEHRGGKIWFRVADIDEYILTDRYCQGCGGLLHPVPADRECVCGPSAR